MIKVAAAIIQQNHQFLICQRPAGKHLELLWEFPGGKQELNETLPECLIRECREELGIEVEIESLFEESTYQYPEVSIQFAFYLCKIQSGTPYSREGQHFCWIHPEDFLKYSFCPADKNVIEKLISSQ